MKVKGFVGSTDKQVGIPQELGARKGLWGRGSEFSIRNPRNRGKTVSLNPPFPFSFLSLQQSIFVREKGGGGGVEVGTDSVSADKGTLPSLMT